MFAPFGDVRPVCPVRGLRSPCGTRSPAVKHGWPPSGTYGWPPSGTCVAPFLWRSILHFSFLILHFPCVGPLRGPVSLRFYGEAFFIFHSSFFISSDVRPLRGRLTAGHLSAGYARPAGLAHPRLSIVGPLRGPVSLRFYGEAFFILHSSFLIFPYTSAA